MDEDAPSPEPGRCSQAVDPAVPAALTWARTRLEAGDPVAALQAVLAAIRMTQGEAAIEPMMAAARASAERRHTSPNPAFTAATPPGHGPTGHALGTAANRIFYTDADALSELIDDVALHQRCSSSPHCGLSGRVDPEATSATVAADDAAHLAADARAAAMEGSLLDGTSVTCPRCGGIIARERASQHSRFWCSGSFG